MDLMDSQLDTTKYLKNSWSQKSVHTWIIWQRGGGDEERIITGVGNGHTKGGKRYNIKL